MLLMIFVNDLWTLSGIPAWLEHAPANVDFLGVADVVFPCFLFIVGMSIPFAIQNRLDKGDSTVELVKHIIIRAVALLVMGVFTVNVPELNAPATGISSEWFQILMVLGFFLIWNVYPKRDGTMRLVFAGLQVAGVVLLIVMAILFRGGGSDNMGRMTPQWWGILGLIGWAYLTCALLYLFVFKRPIWLLIAWLSFMGLTVAGHAGWLRAAWPDGPQDWILGNGAFHALTFSGILATLLLTRLSTAHHAHRLPVVFVSVGFALVLLGLLLRNFFIISKIQATPTWILLCSGIAFIGYAGVYYLVDRRGKASWFDAIKPAGTSALTCYLIPYLFYSIADLSGVALPKSLTVGGVGLIKSLLFAFLIVGITAILGKMKIRLKV